MELGKNKISSIVGLGKNAKIVIYSSSYCCCCWLFSSFVESNAIITWRQLYWITWGIPWTPKSYGTLSREQCDCRIEGDSLAKESRETDYPWSFWESLLAWSEL